MTQIFTAEEFNNIVSRFEAPPGWDYETNGKEASDHTGRLVGTSIAAPIDGTLCPFYIPMAHQRGRNAELGIAHALAEYLTRQGIVSFGSAEYLWSATRLTVKPRIVGDGYCAARLLQLDDKNLKDLSRVVLKRDDVIKLKDLFPSGESHFDFSTLDPQDPRVALYVEDDARNAFELERALREDLGRFNMLALYDLELTAAMFMAENELRGYRMDNAVFIRAFARERSRVEELERQIFGALGGKPFALNSNVQLGKALKALGVAPRLTDAGNESWSIESLKLIRNPPPVVEQIIEWKSAFNVVNSLTRTALRADDTGRVYPRWHSIGTTGDPRIRAERPPLTMLPKVARTAFVAPQGTRWFMWAWWQPEMRALASLSGDTEMVRLLALSFDFYTTIGATLRGAHGGEGTPEDRVAAKRLMFAIVDYCADAERVAVRLGMPVDQALHLIAAVRNMFPAALRFLDLVRVTYTAPGAARVTTSYMNRRWVFGEESDYLPSAVISAKLQHTVATWLKITMGRVMQIAECEHPLFKGYSQWTPVTNGVAYVLDEDVPVRPHLAHLQAVVETSLFGVRLYADYGVGPSWGDIEVFEQTSFAQQMADFLAQRPVQ